MKTIIVRMLIATVCYTLVCANNYLFAQSGMTKVFADDGINGDHFGQSVSISGDDIVIGADGDDDAGNASGSAYVFNRNQGGADNWGEVAKLTASDAETFDEFGNSVSISGDYAIVGAHKEGVNSSGVGAAYIFDRNQGGTDN